MEKSRVTMIERRLAGMVSSCVETAFLKYVIEGKIEGVRTRGRRPKQLLEELKKMRRCWNLKEVLLDHSLENWFWKRLSTCRKTEYR